MTRPLEGITVLAFEHAVAAPFCTRQLADYGARVIKIERPGTGDFARHYDSAVNGLSSYAKLSTKPDKIIALDWYTGVAKPGSEREKDWRRAPDGTPIFARHNKKLNVLFNDSSVRTLSWQEIDFFRNSKTIPYYWDVLP